MGILKGFFDWLNTPSGAIPKKVEPKIVVKKSEQLDGKIRISIDVPVDIGSERISALLNTVDGKLSEIMLFTERSYYDGDCFGHMDSIRFDKEELSGLGKVLKSILDQIYFIEMAQTKKESKDE